MKRNEQVITRQRWPDTTALHEPLAATVGGRGLLEDPMPALPIRSPSPDSAEIERKHHLLGWSGYLLTAAGLVMLAVMSLLSV